MVIKNSDFFFLKDLERNFLKNIIELSKTWFEELQNKKIKQNLIYDFISVYFQNIH